MSTESPPPSTPATASASAEDATDGNSTSNAPTAVGSNSLLSRYEPLSRRSVREEILSLRSSHHASERSWQDEVEAYEGGSGGRVVGAAGSLSSSASSPAPVPQPPPPPSSPLVSGSVSASDRNHPNETGTVDHPHMFPYHDSMYPLLDVYYHLDDGSALSTAVRAMEAVRAEVQEQEGGGGGRRGRGKQ